ncbi:glutamate ligase domain-containing protein, partial [Treponema sp. R6D11]
MQNISLAIGIAETAGVDINTIKAALKNFVPVSGRMEILDTNTPYTVIIDYAHTPDGIEKILTTVRELTRGCLISLFGCGGDRDKTKRPIMGRLASELSDFTIITSDNPRTEDPKAIIDDILVGAGENSKVIVERKEAIKWALDNAK